MRTLQLTHAQVEMLINSLSYLSAQALKQYGDACQLENEDQLQKSKQGMNHIHLFNLYTRYGDLAQEIKNSSLDI